MNWLDWILLALVAMGAVRGFFRGFVVEVASLMAIVLGIWAAVRFNARVAAWIGLDPEQEAIAFLVTFFGVLLAVHLLAKAITKAMDLAMLGLPNKVAGLFFGALRGAFLLSVVLNLLLTHARTAALIPPATLERSVLFRPLRAFAPLIVPALGEAMWVKNALESVQQAAGME